MSYTFKYIELTDFRTFWENAKYIKFSFSENATKIWTIFLMVLTFTRYLNVKTMRTIAQIVVAFSEKLNFTSRLKLLTYQIEKPLECHPLKSPPLYCQTEVREKTLHSSSRLAQAGIANIYFSSNKLSGTT